MIPEGWSEARLGDLGYTFGGLTGKSGKDFGTGSATFVTFMNVMANVVLSADGVEAVNVEPGEAQNQLRAGDVIFNGSSEIPEEVGFGATVPETLEGVYLNSFCFGFRCYPDAALDATFLSYLTRSPVGREVIRPMAQGSTRYNLAKTNLLNGLFPIPPLAEQQAIAEALSDADARVESLDALIAKKRDMKQAAMQQLLTGCTRLLGFVDEWKEVRLGDVGRCLRGVSYNPQSDLSEGDSDTTVRLLRSNNIKQSLLNFDDVQFVNEARVSEEQVLRPGDIVVCMANGSRALVGKSGLFRATESERYTFGAFMGCFRTDAAKAEPGFVRYLFLTKRYLDYISNLLAGSAINNLAPSSIESLSFEMPPPAEQQAIAEVLSDMDAEIDALVAQRAKAELVKQGMMQELLSGRVRLA